MDLWKDLFPQKSSAYPRFSKCESKRHKTRYVSRFMNLIFRILDRKLRNNAFGSKLEMSGNISQQLQLIDLENNDISSVTIGSEYKSTLL